MSSNRNILKLAIPAIITNITIPLLGLVDITIAGHLGNAAYIGAMAVGAMIFNLVYWNFAFLRMGTTGLTAQSFGRKNYNESATILFQSSILALLLGVAIIILQYPIQWVALLIIDPSSDVKIMALSYFYICIWGAPAILLMTVIKGWFLGMQNSRLPMYISVGVNIVNILTSVIAVYIFDMGFRGIAIGTLVAEYTGLIGSIIFLKIKFGTIINIDTWRKCNLLLGLKRFFKVNRDIFIRSMCLMSVTLFFMSVSARSGNVTLAANSIIMQLFILFSYFMDGFAFAGEALSGKYLGAGNYLKLKLTIKALFMWGASVTLIFTLIYGVALEQVLSILTDDRNVINFALEYRWWCAAIPIAGASAFIWDGIFIGMTATKQMVWSIFTACICFFAIFFSLSFLPTNHRLWVAFIIYIAMRGIMQWFLYHKSIMVGYKK